MRASRRASMLLIAVFVAVSPAQSFATTQASTLRPIELRQAVPNVTLYGVNGQRVTLKQYRGRVVMLDFWETGCGGCKVEIPWYLDFQRQYGSRGLTVIGVAMDNTGWKTVKPYMAAHPFDYKIVVGNMKSLIQAFGLVSMPKTLLIDRHGRIADAHTGIVNRQVWSEEIRTLLREH